MRLFRNKANGLFVVFGDKLQRTVIWNATDIPWDKPDLELVDYELTKEKLLKTTWRGWGVPQEVTDIPLLETDAYEELDARFRFKSVKGIKAHLRSL